MPVFEHKAETDANYERCARLLHDHHGAVRAAFASHNLRSLAYAITYGREPRHPRHRLRDPDALRHGRADARRHPPHGPAAAGLRAGRRARARAWRTWCAGCSRTRRNESFVRQRFAEGDDARRPRRRRRRSPTLPGPASRCAGRPPIAARPVGRTSPSRVPEWRRRSSPRPRSRPRSTAPTRAASIDVPAVIGGERVRTDGDDRRRSTRRARPRGRPRRRVRRRPRPTRRSRRRWRQVERWRRTPARERAGVLFGAAELMRARRSSSPRWRCSRPASRGRGRRRRRRGDRLLRVLRPRDARGSPRRSAVQSPPGEAQPLALPAAGVAVVIAPWNFPLAIPTGMTAAALVTGNTVI